MLRRLTLVLFVLAAVSSGIVGADAAGTMDSVETTTTPDDGPDGHADDPFPSWLPLLLVAGLLVGIAAVGGSLWFVFTRLRRFLGR